MSLVGSGRVVSKFHYTDPTRPDQTHGPLESPTSPRTFLVVDLSAQSRHVRTSSVGLVWSGRRRSPWVRVVEFETDQTLSESWSQARTCLVGSGLVRVVEFRRHDQTRPATKSGRARLVEFGHYRAPWPAPNRRRLPHARTFAPFPDIRPQVTVRVLGLGRVQILAGVQRCATAKL